MVSPSHFPVQKISHSTLAILKSVRNFRSGIIDLWQQNVLNSSPPNRDLVKYMPLKL